MKKGRIISVGVTVLMVLFLGMAGVSSAQGAKEFKVGSVHPLTGSMAEVGTNSTRGFKLGFKHINEAGGVKAFGGVKLVVVDGDTGSTDPGMAASV